MGHPKLITADDVLRYIESRSMPIPESGCWVWLGHLCNGYGRIQWRRRTLMVHRVVYELIIGKIPDGKELDHLCRVRSCWNPSHLEPVSTKTNVLRGFGITAINAKKTHCKNGHPLIEGNLRPTGLRRGLRQCVRCHRNDVIARRAVARAKKGGGV